MEGVRNRGQREVETKAIRVKWLCAMQIRSCGLDGSLRSLSD